MIEPHYKSYLLRLWIERSLVSEKADLLRFSLEDARTGRRQGFTRLDDLVAFLQNEARRSQPGQEIHSKGGE